MVYIEDVLLNILNERLEEGAEEIARTEFVGINRQIQDYLIQSHSP